MWQKTDCSWLCHAKKPAVTQETSSCYLKEMLLKVGILLNPFKIWGGMGKHLNCFLLFHQHFGKIWYQDSSLNLWTFILFNGLNYKIAEFVLRFVFKRLSLIMSFSVILFSIVAHGTSQCPLSSLG